MVRRISCSDPADRTERLEAFDLVSKAAPQGLNQIVRTTSEGDRLEIVEDFVDGFSLGGALDIVAVGDHISLRDTEGVREGAPHFWQTTALEGEMGEGTGGVTEAYKRRIVLPLAGPMHLTDHVLGHELVHAFQYDITNTNVSSGNAGALNLPLWFIEGMAEYLSIGPDDPLTAMWMRDAMRREKFPDVDDLDKPFCTGERTVEGFYKTRNGLDQAVARGLAYARYADLIWCETGKPDLAFAKAFADAIHAKFPGKLLAYNCSPSFNWKKNLDDATIARFQRELGAMGYKFQFITLAGFHSLNYSMFHLAHGYARHHMAAFVELQEAEFAAVEQGFTAVKHQREVGTGYFDAVTQTVQGSQASTTALKGSTEDEQFFDKAAKLHVANG